MDIDDIITRASQSAPDRFALWSQICDTMSTRTAAEVGVWRGEFSEVILRRCPKIKSYYLLDPWCHLPNWNKPFNVTNSEFETVMAEALNRTSFAGERRHLLRGTTTEVSKSIPDRSLDFCYIDGDHTLRGITIDILRMYPKMRDGGIIAGDDFCPNAWQHGAKFEPTLVFPAAVYLAEALGAAIYGLSHHQFAIAIDRSLSDFRFRDLTGDFANLSLLGVFSPLDR